MAKDFLGKILEDRQPRQRNPETDEVDVDDRGEAAKQVDVEGRDHTDRPAARARREAGDGNRETPDQDQHLRDHEDVDVDPEGLQDQQEGIADLREVEECPADREIIRDEKEDRDEDEDLGRSETERGGARIARGGRLDARSDQVSFVQAQAGLARPDETEQSRDEGNGGCDDPKREEG